MSDLQQITVIRSQTLTQLVDLRANPKPSYEIDGQRVSWTDYIESLQRTVAAARHFFFFAEYSICLAQ